MRQTILIALLLSVTMASAAPVRDEHVTAELISEASAISPGSTFTVALKLVHDEHWHTYWINDGDSGLPTEIEWNLPDGFAAGPIQWPYPERIPMDPLVSFGFEGETWLLVDITAPPSMETETVTINATAKWLMCKEACIPGKAELALDMPIADETVTNAENERAFARARSLLPSELTRWTFQTFVEDDTFVITATPPEDSPELKEWEAFPIERGILTSTLTSDWSAKDGAYEMRMPLELTDERLPDSVDLVMVSSPSLSAKPGHQAIAVTLPLGADAATGQTAASESGSAGLLIIVLSAFAGGMILNLMPCVFPVISLKILGFVSQAQSEPSKVWRHGLVFASGVVVSFWILAGILIALRAGGESIGWGFQLQSPEVLVVLAILFFVLALNMFGVFEMGLSLTAAGGSLTASHGYSGSFFSGFLATVIATPCTAPFMGAALGYALTQPTYVSMIVFTALAVGMAFPYLVLSRFPVLLKALPKPGPWMETMKQAMGFVLMATVLWLFWVLASLTATHTLIILLGALLLAALAAWILGKWSALNRSGGVRLISRILALALITASFTVAFKGIIKTEGGELAAHDSRWETFSPERLEELRAEGKAVFIDFTAKWCLTCQVNKLTVLRTGDIQQAFEDAGVALLYADWTDENEIIAEELEKYGRQSVPLYLLFPPGGEADPAVLPEILTRKIVLDALNKL